MLGSEVNNMGHKYSDNNPDKNSGNFLNINNTNQNKTILSTHKNTKEGKPTS